MIDLLDDPRELVVVKLGGTTVGHDQAALEGIVETSTDLAVVVVHGGGKRLTEWMARLGLEARFEHGRRVTDDASLELALAVLGGLVNGELVARLQRLGVPAVGLSGVDGHLLVCERDERLGRVARVLGARPAVLYALLAGGFVPVIAPLAIDGGGVICNVNADEAAAGLAGALAVRLVLLTDTDGVRDADAKTITRLDELLAEQLITEGVIDAGMIPKVEGALSAVRSGSPEVVIADGRQAGALARALTDQSFGTRVVGAL